MILLPGDPWIYYGELEVLRDYGIYPLPFVVNRANKSPVCLQVQLRDEENHFIGRGDVFSVIPATGKRALSVTYSPVEGYPVKLPEDEEKILDPSTLPPWALAPYLGNVYIIKKYRGKGFGLQLFQEMVEAAKSLVSPHVNYCLGITAKKRVMEIVKELGGWLIDPDNFRLFCFPDRVKEPDDWLVGPQLNFLSVKNGPYTLPYLIIAGFSSSRDLSKIAYVAMRETVQYMDFAFVEAGSSKSTERPPQGQAFAYIDPHAAEGTAHSYARQIVEELWPSRWLHILQIRDPYRRVENPPKAIGFYDLSTCRRGSYPYPYRKSGGLQPFAIPLT